VPNKRSGNTIEVLLTILYAQELVSCIGFSYFVWWSF